MLFNIWYIFLLGKFGGLQNRAPPLERLSGIVFASPLPYDYHDACAQLGEAFCLVQFPLFLPTCSIVSPNSLNCPPPLILVPLFPPSRSIMSSYSFDCVFLLVPFFPSTGSILLFFLFHPVFLLIRLCLPSRSILSFYSFHSSFLLVPSCLPTRSIVTKRTQK